MTTLSCFYPYYTIVKSYNYNFNYNYIIHTSIEIYLPRSVVVSIVTTLSQSLYSSPVVKLCVISILALSETNPAVKPLKKLVGVPAS